MNKNDNHIKEALKRGTQKAVAQKDSVWQDVKAGLRDETARTTHRKGSVWGRLAVAVAVAALVTIFTFTPPGKAAVAKITDLFAPQKTIDYSIEGEDEQSEFTLQTPVPTQTQTPQETAGEVPQKAMTFVIYVDESRYQTEISEGTMVITPIDYPADYPPVYLQIMQDTERTPQAVAQDLEENLKEQYIDIQNLGNVTAPINCIKLHMLAEYEWNSESVDYYLVNNTLGGTFIIKAQYFLEAEEGHGVRFAGMVKEFQVVPVE